MSEIGGNNNPVLAAMGGGAQTAGAQAQTNQLLQLIAQILVALQSGGPAIPSSRVQGTTTNDNAPPGFIGEYVSETVLVGAAVALTTNTPADITHINLTAGDWDVEGNVCFAPASGTTMSQIYGWTNQSAATPPTPPNNGAYAGFVLTGASFGSANETMLVVGRQRISLAAPATVYLSTLTLFAVSTLSAFGFIGARRAR